MEVLNSWCTLGARRIIEPQINLKAQAKLKYRAMKPVNTGETK
jgi:hypothetical protein